MEGDTDHLGHPAQADTHEKHSFTYNVPEGKPVDSIAAVFTDFISDQ